MSILSFFNKNFILQKKIFLLISFADSLSWAEKHSNDILFVIFGHSIWDLGGGVGLKLTTLQWILVFKYPSRDRVKLETTYHSSPHVNENT